MKTKISYVDYALYFADGKNRKMRPRWILFNVYYSKEEAEEKAKELLDRNGWETKIEKYRREAELN